MAVTKFKPTLWEGAIIANFHSASIAERLSVKPTSVEGEKVIFNTVAEGAIKDYSGTVAWDELDSTETEMTFEKQKYFALKLDDVDKVQLKGDLMKAATEEHAALLAEQYDKDFFVELAKASTKIGSNSAKIKVHQVNIYDKIVDLGTALSEKKVPKTNRFVTVPAAILGLLAKDRRFTPNPKVLENGIVEGQMINGLQVMASQELPANTIIAHHKSAIGCAKQLDKIEAMRLENSFADGVRGIMKYGSKILRDKAIVSMIYEISEPPAATVVGP